MKYYQPLNEATDAPYVDASPASGIEGSAVPAKALEHPQREIVNLILAAGLTPAEDDLTQLKQAILTLIAANVPNISNLANKSLGNLDATGLAKFTAKTNLNGDNITYIDFLNALGFGAISTANGFNGGYIKLPNINDKTKPLIIQWGSISKLTTASPAAITFPIAFPNGLLMTSAFLLGALNPNGTAVSCGLQSATGMNIYTTSGASGVSVGYIAIGV